MDTRESRLRALITTYFPMFIATLSLVTSIYNGYLNNRFVDLIENNVTRVEYMKTCKEIIDAYFVVKVRTDAIGPASAPEQQRARLAANEAVAKFGALGTYLANLRDDRIRERYSQLSSVLVKAVASAAQSPSGEIGKLMEAADRDFGALNDDCIKSAKAQRM